jgi:carbamoyltransferase
MNILGLSGVDGTVAFKRKAWPGREEREYRIAQGHDSAAALVVDGECVAAVAEERISRRKHTGDFPIGAAEACLAIAGLDVTHLDEIVHSFDYGPYRTIYSLGEEAARLYQEVLSPDAFAQRVRHHLPAFPPDRVRHTEHHVAHAASAALTSGWDDCAVVVIDGMGEVHGASVYHVRNGVIERVLQLPASNSIGILYSIVTLHLGFDFNSDEYKIMGLAPYGDPTRFGPTFDQILRLESGGSWEIPLLRHERTREDREFHLGARRWLAEHLVEAREPDGSIDPVHADVAAALQECLDRAILHLCAETRARVPSNRLAMAGGVALNTTANAKLQQSGLFEEIYIQPASADDGSALGAALQRAASAGEVVNRRLPVPFLGPAHDSDAVEAALRAFATDVETTRLSTFPDVCEAAADLIAKGQVIAWYRGRMEFGPRALGHRSILADPSRADMRDRVNAMVKLREAFRPFAPAVAIEEVDRWFEVTPDTSLPYMVVNVQVRPQHRNALPAVTHVDGSARVQTVSSRDNGDFHALLAAVGARTGRQVVLNTSFNVKGQPIVNTPHEAVETFLGTGLDALVVENILVRKSS